MPKKKPTVFLHPHLCTDGKTIFEKSEAQENVSWIKPVRSTCHHLYPRHRNDSPCDTNKITIKIWSYKHFEGWNRLFQFSFKKNGVLIYSELTIDEIITAMVNSDPFITTKLNHRAWKIVFGDKDNFQAAALLKRVLSIVGHRKWKKTHHPISNRKHKERFHNKTGQRFVHRYRA